jgi:predicted HicB family RNase H-like nuclease
LKDDEEQSDLSPAIKSASPVRRSFPLRLARSLRDKAWSYARLDGVSLNHFVTLAVAEKVTRLEQQTAAPDAAATSKQVNRFG